MISLKDDKVLVSKQNILSFISETAIARNYAGDFQFGKAITSPIKQKDDNPSFVLYNGKNGVSFYDFSLGEAGDVFDLVKIKYGVNYYGALLKIIFDFRLEDKFIFNRGIDVIRQHSKPVLDNVSQRERQDIIIDVKYRKWALYDVKYWGEYNISIELLERYDVYPIEYIFFKFKGDINYKIKKADKHAYAFLEEKDNIRRYKIYQPFNKKEKWFSNFLHGTISGWRQIDWEANHIIVTSSLKDTLTLVSIGFNSINPQSETNNFKKSVMKILNESFVDKYIFYDYDRTGISSAFRHVRENNFIPIFTKITKLKDPSDYGRNNGVERLKSLVKKKIT